MKLPHLLIHLQPFYSMTIIFDGRLQLAALHFNETSNRSQAVTKKGEERYDILLPKYKEGGYIMRKVLPNSTHGRFGKAIYA